MEKISPPPGKKFPAIALLISGATTGVVLAAFGLLVSPGTLSNDQVARINNTVITSAQLDEYAKQMNANTPVPRDRNFLLNQMVDEELLVQRGMELGLVEQSTPVRSAIVQAVTRRFGAGTGAAEVPETELRAYYERHIDRFSPPALYTIRLLPAGSTDGNTERHTENNTESNTETPLTYPTLIERFGHALAQEIVQLSPGEQTPGSGDRIIQLLAVQPGEPPPFERIRELVRNAVNRDLAEQAFRDYRAWLRERAEVDIQPQ